jgi:hypothetical protein
MFIGEAWYVYLPEALRFRSIRIDEYDHFQMGAFIDL